MFLRKILFSICLFTVVLCLVAGYSIARQWVGAVIAVLVGPAWLLAKKYPEQSWVHICLLGSVGLAVAGRLLGAPSFLMVFGSGLALAVWDLLLLDSALGTNSSGEPTHLYENKHLQSLFLALTGGFFAILLGRLFTVQIPFIVLMVFITFLLFAIDRVWGVIKKIGRS